jgi:hypothetical protein
MRKTVPAFILSILCAGLLARSALAQTGDLALHLTRDWGYGGFSGDIQGNFTIEASGRPDVVRVEFFLDDAKMGEASQSPFRLQFVTDAYAAGQHTLRAVGHTADGQTVASGKIACTFLSATDASQATLRLVVPILAITFGGMLLAALIPMLLIPKEKRRGMGSPFSYLLGGGICPKCGRPFRFHIYGIKLGRAKYDRCPHCGAWSAVPHVAIDALIAAELTERNAATASEWKPAGPDSDRKALDDSKYLDE